FDCDWSSDVCSSDLFDRITKSAAGREVGVVMSRGNGDKARYALDAEAQILPYYNDYFGRPYPLPKLDNVAGPGQSVFFSAMENRSEERREGKRVDLG